MLRKEGSSVDLPKGLFLLFMPQAMVLGGGVGLESFKSNITRVKIQRFDSETARAVEQHLNTDRPAGGRSSTRSLLWVCPLGLPEFPCLAPVTAPRNRAPQGEANGLTLVLFFFEGLEGGNSFCFFFPSWLNVTSDLQTWKTT